MPTIPNLAMIQAAAKRIAPYVHKTPVLTCSSINTMCHADLYFKCENFQKVGAFKYRGATNAVQSLTTAKATAGVATHSSGNHGAALALAAKTRGIPAYIVMPNNVPEVKKQAVAGYGGQITYCEPNLAAREQALQQLVAETGASFIPPYDDERIICGQATAALELLEQQPDLDVLVTPVGGGGLLAGTAIVGADQIDVIGAEPAGADDAYRSFKGGSWVPSQNPQTICDGLLTSLGQLNFAVIQALVTDIMLASDEQIKQALAIIYQRMKIIVEPSSAVALAVVLAHEQRFVGKKVGIILSGGNVDLV